VLWVSRGRRGSWVLLAVLGLTVLAGLIVVGRAR
jgi:hypothetical protein